MKEFIVAVTQIAITPNDVQEMGFTIMLWPKPKFPQASGPTILLATT